MRQTVLLEFFERDLNKLKDELNSYTEERLLWQVRGEITNSAGNLVLHLLGNLNHFIGATISGSGYVRERDLEFSQKNVLRSELLDRIDALIPLVNRTLRQLTPENLEQDYPLEKHGRLVSTDNMLIHLLTHLNYHLGQINYHRRLIV